MIETGRWKSCDLIYTGLTEDSLKTRINNTRYNSKDIPKINDLEKHVNTNYCNFDQDMDLTILHRNLIFEAILRNFPRCCEF